MTVTVSCIFLSFYVHNDVPRFVITFGPSIAFPASLKKELKFTQGDGFSSTRDKSFVEDAPSFPPVIKITYHTLYTASTVCSTEEIFPGESR